MTYPSKTSEYPLGSLGVDLPIKDFLKDIGIYVSVDLIRHSEDVKVLQMGTRVTNYDFFMN